jgi:hypothetical protein
VRKLRARLKPRPSWRTDGADELPASAHTSRPAHNGLPINLSQNRGYFHGRFREAGTVLVSACMINRPLVLAAIRHCC